MATFSSVSSYLNPYTNNHANKVDVIPVVPPVPPVHPVSCAIPTISASSNINNYYGTPSNIMSTTYHYNYPYQTNNICAPKENNDCHIVLHKVTVQIVRKNNLRGSFNTPMDVPAGQFPTLQSLKTKIDQITTKANIIEYELFFRYGDRGPKYQLNDDDQFANINWQDERLTFNVQQTDTIVGQKRANDESNAPKSDAPKPKKAKKFDQINEQRKTAEKELEEKLSNEIKANMSRADMVQASYLHSTNPGLWTIQKIEEHYQDKKKTTIKKGPDKSGADSTIVMDLQSAFIKLQDRVTTLEKKIEELQL